MQIHGNNIYKQKIHLLIAVKVQDKLQKYVVPFYAVCDGGWMSGGYPSSTDRSVHKFFTKILALTTCSYSVAVVLVHRVP